MARFDALSIALTYREKCNIIHAKIIYFICSRVFIWICEVKVKQMLEGPA